MHRRKRNWEHGIHRKSKNMVYTEEMIVYCMWLVLWNQQYSDWCIHFLTYQLGVKSPARWSHDFVVRLSIIKCALEYLMWGSQCDSANTRHQVSLGSENMSPGSKSNTCSRYDKAGWSNNSLKTSLLTYIDNSNTNGYINHNFQTIICWAF